MKVLLWRDVEKLGKRGEVISVKDGYARNFLIPRRMASVPTPSMYKEFELEKRRQVKQEAELVSEANTVAEKLISIPSVSIEVNTNEEGHLYGAVSPSMISDALKDQGLKVEAKAIEIDEPIKQVGTYEVHVNLHREVKPALKVWVLSTKAVKPEGDAVAGSSAASAEPASEEKSDAAPQA